MINRYFLFILLWLNACSNIQVDKDSWDLFGDIIPQSFAKLPFVYRPLIIQGNLIDQDRVDQLQLGMSRQQVIQIMGTPLLQDIFHDQRWDYYYGIGIDTIELQKNVVLYFEQDRLVKIEGDYQPLNIPEDEQITPTLIDVPDWEPPKKTLFEQLSGQLKKIKTENE